MSKHEAEGPRGSRTQRDHGGDDAWNPKDGKRDDVGEFDPKLAERHRKGHEDRKDGKKP